MSLLLLLLAGLLLALVMTVFWTWLALDLTLLLLDDTPGDFPWAYDALCWLVVVMATGAAGSSLGMLLYLFFFTS